MLTIFSAGAVSRVDNLEFLTDVVPKTISYKEFKAKKAKEDQKNTNGQTTLTNGNANTTASGLNGAAHAAVAPPTTVIPADAMDVDEDELAQADTAALPTTS